MIMHCHGHHLNSTAELLGSESIGTDTFHMLCTQDVKW